ncbi:MAG: exodeoxyribonuclease VII large subunit [Kiritimatiellae bacterium]|nr:exodeoxyribonuclease VII large subunit [Kiritimatiellia bacterium]
MTEVRTYTVSELTRRVKLALEGEIGRVWVTGEVSNLRRQPSGHCYFTLKDAGAQLNAVLFAGAQRNATFAPADGMAVRACGDLTVYEPRGQYQLIVRQIEAAGQGTLMARFEELKRRLQAEGLFEAAHKRPLPLLPRFVGIVTSPSGAALRDILNVLNRRFPNLSLLIAPARVQGVEAAPEIVADIALLNAVGHPEHGVLPNHPPLDVIIVTRGGGSLEDLWPFNEEAVARAVAGSQVPVISAVGHEIDFTICDFAADLRAPTPSAAAELVVGRKDEFAAQLAAHARTLKQALRQRLSELKGRLNTARHNRVFSEPRHAVEHLSQRVDHLQTRLRSAVEGLQARGRQRCERARAALLYRQGECLPGMRARLDRLSSNVTRAGAVSLQTRRQRLAALDRQLNALSPLAVLSRGFSLTQLADGTIVRAAAQVGPGALLRTRLAQGSVESVARRADGSPGHIGH